VADLPARKTYTPAEVAAIIPCRENWLIDRLREGTFSGVKIHRQWRMTESDIDAAIETCRRAANSPIRLASPGHITHRRKSG
jgi:hypothetical protein